MAQKSVNSDSKPSLLKLEKPSIELDQINKGNPIGRTVLNGRYFYHFAEFSDQWTLFVFDSYFRQCFEMYNAMILMNHFNNFDLKYVPYDANSGLVHDQQVVVKIQLDEDSKTVLVVGDELRLPLEKEFPFIFYIYFIEILQNDIVFIYTVRRENNVSQRAYLQDWSDIKKRINMCKIGIRDAGGRLLFVNATVIENNRICLVHMQDKTRPHGNIAPLVLYWNDVYEKVDSSKFEKVENTDGKPYTTAIKGRITNQKHYTGAWHGHLFTMLISKSTLRAIKWSTFMFVYDGLVKTWTHLKFPSPSPTTRKPILALTNGGNHPNLPLLFYSSSVVLPNQMYRMPIRKPEKLMRLALISSAHCGFFNAREKINISRLELQIQIQKREEHKKLAAEHQKLSREHAVRVKKLEKDLKNLKASDLTSTILPANINFPSPQSE